MGWRRRSATPTAAGRRRSPCRERAPIRRPPSSRAPRRSSRATRRRASRSSTRPWPTPLARPTSTCSPRSAAAAATPAHGARQRRPSLDRVVLERHRSHGRVSAAARPRDRRAGRGARAGAQQREQQQQQLRHEPRVRGDLSRRLRQLPGGRAGQHDRLVVAGPDARHDRQPGRDRRRAPVASSPPPTAPTGASGSPGSTARPTAPRSATPPAPAARCRTPACPRERGRRLRAVRDRRRGQLPAGRQLRLGRGRHHCRSRSS